MKKPFKRTYRKGKLFGKLSGTFIFRPKPKPTGEQMPLPGISPGKKK